MLNYATQSKEPVSRRQEIDILIMLSDSVVFRSPNATGLGR